MKDILSEVIASKVRFTIEEAIQEIVYELSSFEGVDDDNPDVSKCLLLIGEAGMGKTRLVKQAAERASALFVSYHHGATIEEDNHGLPTIVNGVTVHAPAAHLAKALCSNPAEADPKEKILLFIDEIFSGQGMGHQNFARMIIDRRYNELYLKPGVRVVAATNPEGGDYCTVRMADRALASRMIPLPIEPSDEERLDYWRTRMPSQLLYKFLLLHKFDAESFIRHADSRTWFNLSHTLAKREKAGASKASMVRLVNVMVGNKPAASYAAFLENLGDPDKYPVSARDLVNADEETFNVIMQRIDRWVKTAERNALIGATKWDICAYLRDGSNVMRVDKRGAKNIGEFCVHVGANGYAALTEDIFMTISRTPLLTKVLDHVRGTKLEERLHQLFKANDAAKKAAAAPKPPLAASLVSTVPVAPPMPRI